MGSAAYSISKPSSSSEIDGVQVLQTLINGRVVYDRNRQGNEDVNAEEMLDRM
jgi:hypothetical protein